jgi:hypothetical protein
MKARTFQSYRYMSIKHWCIGQTVYICTCINGLTKHIMPHLIYFGSLSSYVRIYIYIYIYIYRERERERERESAYLAILIRLGTMEPMNHL